MISMDQMAEQAIERGGAEYLQAEAALRSAGAQAVAALQHALAGGPRLQRLIARMLVAWTGGHAPDNQRALDGIAALWARARETPVGRPEAGEVARYLDATFGDKVVDVLAVRLIKESDWPDWKTRGVLEYLGEHHPEKVAAALARFVVQSHEEPELRQARAILTRIPRAERHACLLEEKQRLAVHRRGLAPDVEALLEDPPR